MTTAHHNESEVARIRNAILAEYIAGQQALSGLAIGNARHDFIAAKQQGIGEHFRHLAGIVGSKQEAITIVAETLEHMEASHATP